jgi:DNA modification methylase
LGRDFVGLDMSAEYLKLAEERIEAVPLGMAL